jgi:hypothetical protein
MKISIIKNYVGYEVLRAVGMKCSIFWDITPCSPSKVNDVWEEYVASACHVSHWLLALFFQTLKMEATYSSETSVDFQWTTQHYIPKDRVLHNKELLAKTMFFNMSFIFSGTLHMRENRHNSSVYQIGETVSTFRVYLSILRTATAVLLCMRSRTQLSYMFLSLSRASTAVLLCMRSRSQLSYVFVSLTSLHCSGTVYEKSQPPLLCICLSHEPPLQWYYVWEPASNSSVYSFAYGPLLCGCCSFPSL